MPRCEGRPDGPCPGGKNDQTVRGTQGDLLLCPDCDDYRFPSGGARLGKSKQSVSKSSATVGTKRDGKSTVEPQGAAGDAGTMQLYTEGAADTRPHRGSSSKTPAPEDSADIKETRVVLNELLAYITHYRDNSSQQTLLRVINSFYSAAEISAAKKCLTKEFQEFLSHTSYVTERRTSSARPACEAELEDILATVSLLDRGGLLGTVWFVARDLSRLPGYAPEETNICSIADQQKQISCKVDQLTDSVSHLLTQAPMTSSVFTDQLVDKHTHESVASIHTKLDDLTRVVKGLRCNSNTSMNAVTTKPSSFDERSREKNIVIFGISESRNSAEWRSTLTDVLQYTAGRSVEVSDAFRIGKFSSGKTRPLIVKLHSVWDKRVILSNCHKLANAPNDLRKIFVVADMPLEERRQKTMKRLHDKAVHENKIALMSSDSLTVDGVLIFTVKDGYVHRSGRNVVLDTNNDG